jgi:hypothetical protein
MHISSSWRMQLLSIKLYKLQSHWQLLIKVLGENIGLLKLKNRIEYSTQNLQLSKFTNWPSRLTFDVLLNDSRIYKTSSKILAYRQIKCIVISKSSGAKKNKIKSLLVIKYSLNLQYCNVLAYINWWKWS